MRHLISGFLHELDPAPARVWSLVVTIYGDCVLPRGGELWLGTLTELVAPFGVEPGSVRAAMSRLARDGFLERTRAGRLSHYALSAEADRLFRAAERVIYRNRAPRSAAGWEIVIPQGEDNRKRLAAEGFGALVPSVFVRPRRHPPLRVSGAIHLVAEGDDAALAAALYPLPDIAARYHAFLAALPPLEAAAADAGPADAVALRIAVVHAFRRIALRDPHLAPDALPPDWPADAAYRAFAATYRALQPASDAWLAAHGENATGKLPAAELSSRFSDPPAADM
jgi:phenylacetic acid degradation operon negative regulatory protein